MVPCTVGIVFLAAATAPTTLRLPPETTQLIVLSFFIYTHTYNDINLHTLRSVNDVTEGITQESPMGAS